MNLADIITMTLLMLIFLAIMVDFISQMIERKTDKNYIRTCAREVQRKCAELGKEEIGEALEKNKYRYADFFYDLQDKNPEYSVHGSSIIYLDFKSEGYKYMLVIFRYSDRNATFQVTKIYDEVKVDEDILQRSEI